MNISPQPLGAATLQIFTFPRVQKMVKTLRDPKDRNMKYRSNRSLAGIWTASTTLGGHHYQAEGCTDEKAMKSCAELILHDMICRQDPLLQRLQSFKSVNFSSTSSSCLSNTRFHFTAHYLWTRGVYVFRGGLHVEKVSQETIRISNNDTANRVTAMLKCPNGVEYYGVACSKTTAVKEAASNALDSLMRRDRGALMTQPLLPQQMCHWEIESGRLEYTDLTSSLKSNLLKGLQRLLFVLKPGQQKTKFTSMWTITEPATLMITARVVVDGFIYTGVSTDSNEANLMAINNAIKAIFSARSAENFGHSPRIPSLPPNEYGTIVPLLPKISSFRDFGAMVDEIVVYAEGGAARAKYFAAKGNLSEAHLHSAEEISLSF